MIRIKHGDYDCKSASGTDIIDKLIKHLKLDTHASDLETAIGELAWDFSCVQKAYHDWAKQFKNHLIWYLLYFIHPVRHELYYFDIHYPDGYSSRLASLIRVHRLGLKGAKTYLSKEGRTTADPYIRACGTTVFKHLHLHPTTSALGKTKRI